MSSTRWCQGFPELSTRELSDAEKRTLRRERTWRLLEMLSLPPAALLVPILVGTLLFWLLPDAHSLVVVPTTLFLFGAAFALLRVRDCFRRRRAIARDLKAGRVYAFGGATTLAASQAAIALLRQSGAPQSTSIEFETLAGSGRLWTVQGEPPRRYVLLEYATPADVPEHARIAAEWVRPVVSGALPANALHMNTRMLTESELEELNQHARRAVIKLFQRSLIVVVLGALSVRAWVVLGARANIIVIGFLVFLVSLLGRWREVLKFALLLRRDRLHGQVCIVRVAAAADGSLSPPTEHLPASKLLWSEDGRPARWRSLRAGVET